MKRVLLIILSLTLILGLIVTLKLKLTPEPIPETVIEPTTSPTTESASATTTKIIGTSVNDLAIESYTFGSGDTNLLFVGGIHGGYEWNSILLAYEMIDYLNQNLSTIPNNLTIHIIPNLNPDGLYKATGLSGRFLASDITNFDMHQTGAGRFNANGVDLNRNFACKWAPESTWRNKVVSAGTAAFSEPEAKSLRDYVMETKPKAAIFWHSQANNVYASECEDGVLPETITLMNTYATVSGYGAVASFDAYPVTGDAEGWLASIGIPAITVELGSRTDTESKQNLAGVKATMNLYAE